MSFANNPISMRNPLQLGESDTPHAAQIRYLTSGIVDLNQAIVAMKGLFDNLQSSVTTIQTTVNTVTPTPPPPSPFPYLGAVNDQIGVTAYTIQISDCGAKIILGDAAPITLTLDATVGTPWFAFIDNDAAGVATLSPTSGVLNGATQIPGGASSIIFFDGTNWWASTTPEKLAKVANQWIDSYDPTTGNFTTSQPTAVNVLNPLKAVGAPYFIQTTDYRIRCDSGPYAVVLPDATPLVAGTEYSVKNVGVGTVTLLGFSGQKIDADSSQPLTQWDNLVVCRDAYVGWIIL